ncbi:CHAD domain-containing protein [bacterium]|nr:MAG: CHAD domain-containing protein [bacterium]
MGGGVDGRGDARRRRHRLQRGDAYRRGADAVRAVDEAGPAERRELLRGVGRPADAGVGRLGREGRRLLAEAAHAAGRSDAEALHDFRVALRRLRALLGAADVGRLERRALRGLLRATNAARDAQMELAWLARAARAPLLRRARLDLRPDPPRGVFPRFRALHRDILESLGEGGRVRKAAARSAFAKLAGRLRRLRKRESSRALHRARVAAKSLRYRLELVGPVEGLPSVGLLRSLQKALGEVHDRDVLLVDLGRWRAPGALVARARAERALSLRRARLLCSRDALRKRARRAA